MNQNSVKEELNKNTKKYILNFRLCKIRMRRLKSKYNKIDNRKKPWKSK